MRFQVELDVDPVLWAQSQDLTDLAMVPESVMQEVSDALALSLPRLAYQAVVYERD